MPGRGKSAHIVFTFHGEDVDAVVKDQSGTWLYDDTLKDASGDKPYKFCRVMAERIASELDANVNFSVNVIGTEDTPRNRRDLMRHEYELQFLRSDDPYEQAELRQMELDETIGDAKVRAEAFADDAQEHESLIHALVESMVMWQECESRLRDMKGMMTDDAEVLSLARKITQAHDNATKYEEKIRPALENKMRNTSSMYRAGESMQRTGHAMQGAADSMKSFGHSMTVGCTIPAIVLAVLVVLFMLFFRH